MGVSLATVNRILNLTPGRRPDSKAKHGEWTPTAETLEGLMRWPGFVSKSELYDALESAPPAPPPETTRRARARPRGN